MKLGKLLIAAVTATVLLSVIVGSASARNISISSVLKRSAWTRINLSGGFGTVECELVLELTWHSRTFPKTVGTLLGYVTAGNITRCSRGGATIDRESLPWHDRYHSFVGTLPNFAGFFKFIVGVRLRTREPTFGITCQVTNATLSAGYTIAGGVVTQTSISGTSPCGPSTATFSGTTTNVDNRSGARLTITLI